MIPPRPAGMPPTEMAANPTSSAITTNTNYTVVSVSHLTNTSDAEPSQASGTQGKMKPGNKMTRDMKAASAANNHIVASSSNLVHPPRPVMAPMYQNHSMHTNFQGLPPMPVQPNSWQDLPGHLWPQLMQPQAVRQSVPRNTSKNMKPDHRHGHDPHKFPPGHSVNNRNDKKADDAVIQESPHFQREVYSYILQKEGPEAACTFMENIQGLPKAPQSYEGEPLFKHNVQMTNALKEASLKEGIPIVQSGVRHDQTKLKNKSPVRSLYQKDGSVTVSVCQNDQRQRVRHSSQSSVEGDNSNVITWQASRPTDPLRYQQDTGIMLQKEYPRFPDAYVQYDTGNDLRPEPNCIGSNRARPQRKSEPCKSNAATVNVANFLDPEQVVSSVRDDLLGDYLDTEAPSGVDHVVRFIEDSIDNDDSDSDLEQSRYFPRKKKTNSIGNLTMAEVPTYAGILRGEGSKTPGRMRHMSAPQSLYSGGGSVFGPSGMTTSNGSRLHETLPHQHSSGDLLDMPLSLDVDSDCFNRFSSYSSSQTSLHQDPVDEENVKNPLELLKNLDFKNFESTKALYNYFQ
jgi:hypothetical protein